MDTTITGAVKKISRTRSSTVPADFNLALSVFFLVRGVQMIHEPNLKCQKTASVFNPNAKN